MAIPSRYKPKTTFCPLVGNRAAANSAYTVSLAPQDINGAIEIVSRRSLSLPSDLAAMTEGTLQPNPTIRGTNAVPGRPILAISRSTTKAARDM